MKAIYSKPNYFKLLTFLLICNVHTLFGQIQCPGQCPGIAIDDANPCTLDCCDPATFAITHTEINPNDGDSCTIDGCNPSIGVFHNQINISDGDVCTIDACNSLTGTITHTTNYDDGNPCTTDACTQQDSVTHTPLSNFGGGANDGLICTEDNCLNGQTVHPAVPTDDNNPCTVDACTQQDGVIHTALTNLNGGISDGSVCTEDNCLNGQTVHLFVPTDDSNPCTTDACTQQDGVTHTDLTNSGGGASDGLVCTEDNCLNGQTVHPPVPMDDIDACTADGCDPLTGVFHIPLQDDHNACTLDLCDPSTGLIIHIPQVINDGNPCTTDGCNTLTGVFHNPVGGTLSKIIFYNQFLELTPLDSAVINDLNPNPINICADGSQATEIEYYNNDSAQQFDDIAFRILEDTLELNKDMYGSFTFPIDSNGTCQHIRKVYFIHPTFMDLNGLYRQETIQVYNNNNGTIIYNYPIRIYRAPVLMVHGIWSNGAEAFQTLEDALLNQSFYPRGFTLKVNYPNDQKFSSTYYYIPSYINQLLTNLIDRKFSVGKVDIVAHSMGGILSRIYLQNDNYRFDIHKLITINTPHSGTQIANFLLSSNIVAEKIRKIMEIDFIHKNVHNGAVLDLSANSDALYDLNVSNLYKQHFVPSHAIVTTETMSNYGPYPSPFLLLKNWPLWLATTSAAFLGYAAADQFLDYIYYGSPNDLVVPIESQKGGIGSISIFGNQMHSSQHNPDVIARIKLLLNENPNNNAWFSTYGFHPPASLPSHYIVDPQNNLSNHSPSQSLAHLGSVNILSPTINSTFNSGTTVSIQISSDSSVNKLICSVTSESEQLDFQFAQTSLATMNFAIPDNFIGKLSVLVMGFDSTGFVDFDTISINAISPATLDSITFTPDTLYIPSGSTRDIDLIGHYSDSIVRTLNYADSLSFIFADTSIAERVANNVITGKNMGVTHLKIVYRNDSINVPIKVLEADSTAIVGFEKSISINLKLFIEGYYLGNGQMESLLYHQNMNSNPRACDSITVFLHNNSSPYEVVDSVRALLMSNGNCVANVSGFYLYHHYYISLKQRNSIETWSSDSVFLNSFTINYDFTNAANKAYGNNLKDLGDGNFAIWSGDISDATLGVGHQDGVVESQDYGDMENAVYLTLLGYNPEDLTGDGIVESSDYGIMENNVYYTIVLMRP